MYSGNSNFFLNFLILKKYRVLRHVSILIFLFIVIVNYKGEELKDKIELPYQYYLLSFAYLVLVIFFYVNMYVLIPKLLYRKYYVTYLLTLVIGVCLEFFVIKFFASYAIDPYRFTDDNTELSIFARMLNVSLVMLPFILSSTALKLFQRWISDNEKIAELENRALKIELKALKNQINPHFLFNMLNNLNVLIKKDPEKASEVTIKLSAFLRHHLYDNNQPLVYLSSEIKFIEDFLELEKIRRDDFSFEVELKGDTKPNLQVPPNIFTVFVENAIKHSLDSDLPSSVWIDFVVAENFIHFICGNTKPKIKKPTKNEGLGLQNVRRRLELLYGTKHTLNIDDSNTSYIIDLKLPL